MESDEEGMMKSRLRASQQELVNRIVVVNNYAKNYRLSEHKVIIWSKHNIMHGNLSQVRGMDNFSNELTLTQSDFEIRT